MPNPSDDFREAIWAMGLEAPDHIEPGKFYRFPGFGMPSENTDCWCFLFEDGLGGCFGDPFAGVSERWQAGCSETWDASRSDSLSLEEQVAVRRRISNARAQAELDRKTKQKKERRANPRRSDNGEVADDGR